MDEADYDRKVDTLKKEVLNFKRTGKVYPDEGVLSVE